MVVRVIPLEDAAVTLGRDLSNRVVLVDENVSGHHAVVQRSAEGATIRDLGSTNGTFVNGEPIASATVLADGDELRLGPEVRLRVRQLGRQASGYLVVRDLTAGTVHVIDGDRFLIGSAPGSHIRLREGPERAATLIVHADGETWLGTADSERPLALDEPFEIAGATFQVELMPESGLLVPTARPMLHARYPYTLTVTLDGAAGALAQLVDRKTDIRCEITSEQRVSLLYLLARQLTEDRKARVMPALAGWCHDEDLMVGVWGREGLTGAASRYSVLLHRVRKELEGAGLDPWCLEKRRGGTRLQVAAVELA